MVSQVFSGADGLSADISHELRVSSGSASVNQSQSVGQSEWLLNGCSEGLIGSTMIYVWEAWG